MAEIYSSIGNSMLSLQDIAAIKVTILACNDLELKREILYTPCGLIHKCEQYHEKRIWNEIVEKKTRMVLRKFTLPKALQEKVISAVFVIGIRMVIWAEYHEGTFGFSREFSLNFLNGSFFTTRGIIDNKKAAEELMNVKCLGIQQKYKVACLYCLEDDIPVLFRQMSRDGKAKHASIRQPALVRYWSHFLNGELDKIKGEKTRDQYMLEKAVENGSRSAVEYCFKQTILQRKEFDFVYAALGAVRNRVKARGDDWVIFYNKRYDGYKESWVPTDYYVDIVFFLLSTMREDQQTEFLQKDIDGIDYEREPLEDDHKRSRVLEYLLNWPYQDNFMKTANLMWDFLPEKNYAGLLLKICDRIGPRIGKNVNYGEEKIYDYRGLLKEFWHQSPERFKRYVFSKQEVHGKIECVELLIKLLKLENFTNEDGKIIELILASAMVEEKENIFVCMELRNIWIQLMEEEKWTALNVLTVNWFPTKEEADRFKREFIFRNQAQSVCIDFVKNDKWNSVHSALKWSVLSEEEIVILKKEMINSTYGRRICKHLIVYYDKYQIFHKFVKWCFPSEEEVKAFKKEIVYTDEVMKKCAEFAANESSETLDKLTSFFLSSEEEIEQFRKDVAYRVGDDFCGYLISHYSCNILCDEQRTKKLGHTYIFQGGRWKEVEKFLTWCFSSEKEINEYKSEKIKVLSYIHHDLIKASQFEEAEMYFAWLGLSAEEIKKLKKDDFFNTYMTDSSFLNLFYVFDYEKFNYFYDFGRRDEDTVELLLRWYFADKETLLEFSGEFKQKYLEEKFKNKAEVKDAFKKFDLAIAQRLSDLDVEKMLMKRNS